MAAEIKPVPVLATSATATRSNQKKPILLHKIEGYEETVNQAVILPGEDGVVAVCDDRSVRVWLKRDSGQFWPSICHYMPSGATSVCFTKQVWRVFVGQENGTISEFVLAEDYNSLTHKRDYLSHHARVTQVHHASTPSWILSVGRDKWFQYYCAVSGKRLGGHICPAWAYCLEFDFASRHVFIGDASGQITMLKLDPQPDLAGKEITDGDKPDFSLPYWMDQTESSAYELEKKHKCCFNKNGREKRSVRCFPVTDKYPWDDPCAEDYRNHDYKLP